MRVLGVDLATEPKGTAACWLDAGGGSGTVELVSERLDNSALLRLFSEADRVAVDAPFGWPEPFVAAITTWRDTGRFDASAREPLRLRATDLYVKERALTPFSVSADKIGALAMRCAHLLTCAGMNGVPQIDRVHGKIIECYPSAALYRFGFTRAEVKGAKTANAVRDRLVREIERRASWLTMGSDVRERLAMSGDAFDAFLAALVARAVTLRLTSPPPAELSRLAQLEGWIHLPLPHALERLGGPEEVAP